MRRHIIIFLFLASISALTFDAKAQRLVPGQHVISAELSAWEQYGLSLSWGKCGFNGRSLFGLSFLNGWDREACQAMNDKDETTGKFDLLSRDLYASGGYLFRIAGNRSRSFNFWGGGTLDAGIRIHDLYSGVQDIPGVKFIFGISPHLQLEYFPDKNISLNLNIRPRVQLYGHKVFEKVFYPEVSVGCAFYILN